MPLSSAALFDAALNLRALARRQSDGLVYSDWGENSGAAITAFAGRERRLMLRHRESLGQMHAVADVLEQTGEAAHYVESDIDRLVRQLDSLTQRSADVAGLLGELSRLGDALDRACAKEIRLICTPQLADGTNLKDFSGLSLAEIHDQLVETAPAEVLAVLSEFPDAQLLPSSDGIVLAFGDIETAPAVATVIPGVGSANPADWFGYAERTRRLAGYTSAAVLWIDYSAPSTIPAAVSSGAASIGAGRLREFQAELRRRAARQGNEPHLTVLGHSYGSVVAGFAARDGLHTDALVFAGSPGVGVDSAAELDIRSENPVVVSTTSPHDPIGLAVAMAGGAHGPDPADPEFGAEVWPAAGGHSSYWDDPEFYRRLGELSTR